MDKILLRKYREYATTEEAFAVLFIREHLQKAQGHWIDITDSRQYEMSDNNLHFRYVHGNLFKRILQPKYPSKSEFTFNGKFDEWIYTQVVRAITWDTAHKDIEQQKKKGLSPLKFSIKGVRFDKNKGNKNYFCDDAPPEIKALEKNLSIRTDPLWDCAMQYINKPEFVYKIKGIRLY